MTPSLGTLAVWARLHSAAPKLFPEWGSEVSTPLRLDWDALSSTDPDRATLTVLGLLRALGLGWAWDTRHGELAVQDAQGSYGYHGTLPHHLDTHAVLLDGLADLLTDFPELGEPDLWPDGVPLRRPELAWTADGWTMDGRLILPVEPRPVAGGWA